MPVDSYRIRWGIVSYGGGYRFSRERMCLAERRYSLLGCAFWFPFQGAEWRFSGDDALRDIDRDMELRKPLPQARVVV